MHLAGNPHGPSLTSFDLAGAALGCVLGAAAAGAASPFTPFTPFTSPSVVAAAAAVTPPGLPGLPSDRPLATWSVDLRNPSAVHAPKALATVW